jgi:hypothetical protein
MSDPKVSSDTPASPHADPSKRHGDALLDGSGSRHGTPPEESALPEDERGADEQP